MTNNFDTHEPIGHYILLVPKMAAAMTDSGLYIPEQARDNLTQGTIVKKGSLVEEFDMGDEVVYVQHTEQYIVIDGVRYILLEDSNIVLVKRVKHNADNPINVLIREKSLSFDDALEQFRKGYNCPF